MFKSKKIKEFFNYFHSLEISWQIYSLFIVYLAITIMAFYSDWRLGLLLLFLLLAIVFFFTFNIKGFIRDLTLIASQMSKNVALAQEYAIYHAPIGVLLYDPNDRITWVNPTMQVIFSEKELIGEDLNNLDHKLQALLKQTSTEQWQEISLTNGYYRGLHHSEYRALYLYDITHDIEMQQVTSESIVVMGHLLLDDYDDLLYAMDDEASAKFESDLISELNRWADQYQIFLKQVDEDQFILLLNRLSLSILEEEKFNSFERIRQKYYDKNIPISMSLGLSYSNDIKQDILGVAKHVRANLDLALGRGGDQVVVRPIEGKAKFYGGKTSSTEKRSDIRAKMFFQAMKSAVVTASNVIIVGHRFPDTDSIGSALGIYHIIKNYGKEVHILINKEELNHDVTELLATDYFENEKVEIFIQEPNLDEILKEKTLFILVDHHRPSISEAEQMMEKYDKVVIDHHRRSEEFPNNTVLTYLEPSASSTSELVTDYYVYAQDSHLKMDTMTATALMAGIVVDTNQFSLRTGSRTFEAAAFLKANGADTMKIQYLLKESLETIKERNRLIEKLEIFSDGYGITLGEEDNSLDNVTAAQTADEMLGIEGIEASFVVYRRSQKQVGISARSLGKINVQTIMESLGGGGHLSNAATQLSDISIEEAKQQLLEVINQKEEK
ncbi:DHH family phosphoesterase [Facklamia sp. DSM 111018]|uniref:Cyclic-di-AMP phosphodiesterase n=1 Tax=Facklamia lactis TaxID=2749967 RepID=A0ABS0LUR9_9LACT|nr:DHH family phosphoesterase [Facklamia lactis]MBG9981314.1 DHH family phosphoesterase [Facklamia lactis]MBG9987210.1 DHH family phosphoesterase [Facklamia lactis]